MKWYVHRRADGTIASAHAERRKGYAEERVDESDPELRALFGEPAPSAAQRRDALAAALADGSGAVTRAEMNEIKRALRAWLL